MSPTRRPAIEVVSTKHQCRSRPRSRRTVRSLPPGAADHSGVVSGATVREDAGERRGRRPGWRIATVRASSALSAAAESDRKCGERGFPPRGRLAGPPAPDRGGVRDIGAFVPGSDRGRRTGRRCRHLRHPPWAEAGRRSRRQVAPTSRWGLIDLSSRARLRRGLGAHAFRAASLAGALSACTAQPPPRAWPPGRRSIWQSLCW